MVVSWHRASAEEGSVSWVWEPVHPIPTKPAGEAEAMECNYMDWNLASPQGEMARQLPASLCLLAEGVYTSFTIYTRRFHRQL